MKNFLNLSDKQIEEINKRVIEDTFNEYQEFISLLTKRECYLCNKNLANFDINEPCLHWLLRPSGFDKKHFPLVYKKYDYFRIQPYLRWLANTEAPFKNINDLVKEKSSKKIVENTIKYKNYEWSFSCSEGDFKGHPNSQLGNMPHYHFQMRIDGKIFISYSNFHIPFTEYDLWVFAAKRGEFGKIRPLSFFDIGMQGVLDEIPPEQLLEGMQTALHEEQATFHMSTMVEAAPGTTISGDDIASLIEESKKTGVPMAKLIRKLGNVTATTIITPGPGVPEIAGRKDGRGSTKR